MRAAVPAMGPMVRVVPNVVDTDLFCPAKEERLAGVPVGATRRKMEGRGMERILHVSSMNDEQKNITGLLSALSPILKSNSALHATFVGGEKAHLDAHRRWVSQEGLNGRIEFTGPLGTDQVVQHMQMHDVLVLNSRRENFPCVIPEAWACGLPVMSTDVGGIREHLPSGISPFGFLLPAQAGEEDWNAAWDLVAKAQWNPEQLRGHAVHHFSMDAVGMAYLDVYRSLLG
jgi:glycosyltransferase involved in cell wall biosynthesis